MEIELSLSEKLNSFDLTIKTKITDLCDILRERLPIARFKQPNDH